jgi:hypothetical protein
MLRVCTKCGEARSIEFFNRDRTTADGFYPQCKNCTRANCRKVYRKYHDRHIEMKRAWKAHNGERHREINRQYWAEHPEKAREGMIRYRARTKRATPPWVDLAEIKLIHEMCPKGWHTDHIHPLAGANFCGLNVPWNLQYLPKEEHWRKGTKPPVEAGGHYNL